MYHHDYLRLQRNWDFVQACYSGTDSIKDRKAAQTYLPMLRREREEFLKSPDQISRHYELRKSFACFENFFKPVIDDIVGIMQKNEPTVKFGVDDDSESPEEVREIRWYGNQYNDGLTGLKYRLNFNQALYGRYGLLLDIVTDPDGLNPKFCITEYPALKIYDGEARKERPDRPETLRFVLLNESTYVFNRESKDHEMLNRWRVLGLDAHGRYYQSVLESTGNGHQAEWLKFDLDNPPADRTFYPMFKGRFLNFIPFTVCNVNRIGFNEWQNPPYEDVAHIAVNNYQIDSIYKQALQNHATPTLVVSNASNESEKVYLGGVIWAKGAGSNPVNVSLLETSGNGLAEMRSAKEFGKSALKYSSIRDLLDGAGAGASGEAIKLRTASGTANIAAMDNAGALAIEEQLVYAAIWAGATPEEAMDRITFRADTSYLDSEVQLQSVVGMIQMNQQTRTLSNEALYRLLDKAVPGVLPTYEDNEIQKIADMEDMLSAPMPLNAVFNAPLQGGLTLPSPGTTTPRTGAQQNQTEDNAQNRNPGDDDDEMKKKPSPE